MDRGGPSSVSCSLCGAPYTLPEDERSGNPPHVLPCGHIFCAGCLLPLEADGAVVCPSCTLECALPEGGVRGLQEDSRIIGLIYTARMNRVKSDRAANVRRKLRIGSDVGEASSVTEEEQPAAEAGLLENVLDEALAQAAENIAQLEHIHQSLVSRLELQARWEKARLLKELDEAVNKATQILHHRKEAVLSELNNMEAFFPSRPMEVCHIQHRVNAIELAMQKAKQVRLFPSLQHYCNLDKMLETLRAPVDVQSFDMNCVPLASGLSCVFRANTLSRSLKGILKINTGGPQVLSDDPPPESKQQRASSTKGRLQREPFSSKPLSRRPLPRSGSPSDPITFSQSGSPCDPGPLPWSGPPYSLGEPDVLVEMFYEEDEEDSDSVIDLDGVKALLPTGPEMANDQWRPQGGRRPLGPQPSLRGRVLQWVVVTHVVNPNNFYVRYLAETKEHATLSQRINQLCSTDNSFYTPSDTLGIGCQVLIRLGDGSWVRAVVRELWQGVSVKPASSCSVAMLASLRTFLLDFGRTHFLSLPCEVRKGDLTMRMGYVREHVRKVELSALRRWAPLAIRCSLKDLVPADLAQGWTKEARTVFSGIVSRAVVEMQVLGQDRNTLQVDLRKAPMDKASQVPISVREYLVLVEVARFNSPATYNRKPPIFYPAVFPPSNTVHNAVVTHVNSPSDFYIQLVDNMEFLLLTEKLQLCYSFLEKASRSLQLHCPVLEQACVARYDDQCWYRAQITGLLGNSQVEVQYIDLGSRKSVSVSDLRKIKDEFFALPAMAIQCCLSDALPLDRATWSQASTDRFTSMALQKLVVIVAIEAFPQSQPLPVRVFESSLDGPQANMAQLLVTEELASVNNSSTPAPPPLPAEEPVVWDPPLEDILSTGSPLGCVDGGHRAPAEQRFGPLNLLIPTGPRELPVRVTHINSPGSFHVQVTQYDAQLQRLCERLQRDYSLSEPQEVEWEADMFCAALINGVWERGRISNAVTSCDSAEVLRCDYGNKVKVDVCNLRHLESALVGSLALECSLNGIRPTGGSASWTATACDFLTDNLSGAQATISIKELNDEGPASVSLLCFTLSGQEVSLADVLVSEGLALKERTRGVAPRPSRAVQEAAPGPGIDSHIQTCLAPAAAAAAAALPPLTPPVSPPSPPLTPPPLSKNFPHPTFLGSSDPTLSDLTHSGPSYPTLSDPTICSSSDTTPCDPTLSDPTPCCPSDPTFCSPSDPTPSSSPDPTPCDPTLCSPSDPTPCDPTLCSPSDPTPCDPTLSDPTPCDPTLSDPTLCCPSDPTPCDPTLSDPTLCCPSDPTPCCPSDPTPCCPSDPTPCCPSDPTLSDPTLCSPSDPTPCSSPDPTPSDPTLSDPTLCSPSDPTPCSSPDPTLSDPTLLCPSVTMAPIPAHRTHASAEKVRTEPYRDPELPELGRIHAMVSAVREDGVIYIRTQQAEVQLELLKERIQRTIKTLPKQRPYTWKCVVGCALMGPDMLWYRGEVLNALEGQLKLRYVDSGFVENIPVVHVYPMLLCEEVPRLCFPCVLHRVTPVGKRWQRDAVALLKELLLGRSVDVEVMELPADPQGAPAVRVFVDGLNLSAILYHHQHTSTPEDTLTLPRPFLDVWDMDTEGLGGPQEPVLGPFSHARLPREAKFEVKVKHLCTPNTVFLCPLEGGAEVEVDGETLDEALTRITADVERLAPLSHFPRGGACLARYSDGNYYRARLAELVGLDPVTALVRHVDFGSEDTPPVSTLRQMPPELLHFPARALRVRVAGFRAPSAGPGGDALPYCPEWSVRAAMCMLELLHGHVTASVVAWEPEPTVLLYDGEGAALHLPLLGAGLAEEDHAHRAPPTAGVEL